MANYSPNSVYHARNTKCCEIVRLEKHFTYFLFGGMMGRRLATDSAPALTAFVGPVTLAPLPNAGQGREKREPQATRPRKLNRLRQKGCTHVHHEGDSTTPPAAIETKYGCCIFRSRLEARWAVLFTHLKIHYEYEPEGFNLPDQRYLPDFYFPQIRMFGEVKPRPFERHEITKAFQLAEATQCPVLMLVGAPAFRTYDAVHCAAIDGGNEPEIYDYLLDIDWHERKHFNEGRLFGCVNPWERNRVTPELAFSEPYRRAVYLAKSWRFDESGRW